MGGGGEGSITFVVLMKRFLLLIVCCLGAIGVHAQVETDSLASPEDLMIVVYKDPRLDILQKRPAIMARIEAEEGRKPVNYNPIVSADGKKKVTGSIYTKKGFRIIIYNGQDRTEAMNAKNKFMRIFPNMPSYMSYNVPSYKIKVGNFENRGEAATFMRSVSKQFPTSFIVPDLVTIKNINVTD